LILDKGQYNGNYLEILSCLLTLRYNPIKARVRGEISWVEGEWQDKSYTYKIQYETRADWGECTQKFDIMKLETFGSIYPHSIFAE
jgi:hypothetical protein